MIQQIDKWEYSDENEANIFHYIPENNRYRPMTKQEMISWTIDKYSDRWLIKCRNDNNGWYDPKLCDFKFEPSFYQRRRKNAAIIGGKWYFLSLIQEFVVDRIRGR